MAGCGGTAPAVMSNHAPPPAPPRPVPSTDGTGYAAELARAYGAVADTVCACKDRGCADSRSAALARLREDVDRAAGPPADDAWNDSDLVRLGAADSSRGLDACWTARAGWELARAAHCAALSSDAPALPAAPSCPPRPPAAPPELAAWWTAQAPCPAGTRLERTGRDSFEIEHCVSADIERGRVTRWWAANHMPAYDGDGSSWTSWYIDGKVAATQHVDPATRTTRRVRYYPDGVLADELTLVGDEHHPDSGSRTEYWPNGHKRAERQLAGRHVQTYWYEDGTKAAELAYDGEVQDGPFTRWSRLGKVAETGAYSQGAPDGEWERYDDAGTLTSSERWDHGQHPKPTPKIAAASLLDEATVRALAGFKGELTTDNMLDPSESYDDIHYRASDKPETFDVALRVWAEDPAAAQGELDELRKDLANARPASLGDAAITAEDPEIYGVAFYDKRGVVVLITCGKQQCRTAGDAMKLARKVKAKLPALW
ncbi:MAG TPA: hypothetical protein VLX92_01340 [Kofleriaceae bacterium]|nr:hypothetical protein [Kofleriaceae bacterium]